MKRFAIFLLCVAACRKAAPIVHVWTGPRVDEDRTVVPPPAPTRTPRGRAGVEVRAESLVSLNGRRARLLVDPDLGRVEDGVAPASWILPAPSVDPPAVRPL